MGGQALDPAGAAMGRANALGTKAPRPILALTSTQEWLAAIDRHAKRRPEVATAVRFMYGLGLREEEAAGARWDLQLLLGHSELDHVMPDLEVSQDRLRQAMEEVL